jgi:tryptophan synthase beta chain
MEIHHKEIEKHIGKFGGQYAPEILKTALDELETCFYQSADDKTFQDDLKKYHGEFIGRPSILYLSRGLTDEWGGPEVYLKREDLNFTGSHKINNTVGQALLALRMGKKRIIAETGAGQHGLATATVCAHFGFECHIYMGEVDISRQALNVYKMELLGAHVHSVSSGQGTLKDATSEAMRDWALNVKNTHYIIGSVVGPHPFPVLVNNFQKIIGQEAFEQYREIRGKNPYMVAACVGGGSNAAGLFTAFIPQKDVKILGVEAGGRSFKTGEHASSIKKGSVGVFHSFKSYLLQDEFGQISPVHSISAGLDYPGVGPLHASLYESKRAEYVSISDQEAVDAFSELAKTEGILPALESAHALAGVRKYIIENNLQTDKMKDCGVIICLSGRGDKDVSEVAKYLGHKI